MSAVPSMTVVHEPPSTPADPDTEVWLLHCCSGRIDEDGHARHTWHQLTQELQALRRQLEHENVDAGQIAARLSGRTGGSRFGGMSVRSLAAIRSRSRCVAPFEFHKGGFASHREERGSEIFQRRLRVVRFGSAEPPEHVLVTYVINAVDQQVEVELRCLGDCTFALIVVADAPSLSHRQERKESWR